MALFYFLFFYCVRWLTCVRSRGLASQTKFQPTSTNSPTKNFRWPSFTFRPIKNHYIISRSHGMGGDVGFSVSGRAGVFSSLSFPSSFSSLFLILFLSFPPFSSFFSLFLFNFNFNPSPSKRHFFLIFGFWMVLISSF